MPKPKQLQDAHDTRFKSNLHGVSELSARISKKFDNFDSTVAKVKNNFAYLALNATSNRFRDVARPLGSNRNSQRNTKALKPHTVRSLAKTDIESSNRSQLGLAKEFKHAELSKHEDSFFKRAGGESKRSINSQSNRNSNRQVIKLNPAYTPSQAVSQSVLPTDRAHETEVRDKQMTPIQELFRIRTNKSPATAPKSVLDNNESKMVSERTVPLHSSSKLSGTAPGKKSRFVAETSPDQQSAATSRAAQLISAYESAKQQASSARKHLDNLPKLPNTVNKHLESYLRLSTDKKHKQMTGFEQNFEDGVELFDGKGRVVAGPQEIGRRGARGGRGRGGLG